MWSRRRALPDGRDRRGHVARWPDDRRGQRRSPRANLGRHDRAQLRTRLAGHADWVRSVALSPDGQTLASGANDCKVCLWNATSGECLFETPAMTNAVAAVSFHPNGQQLAVAGFCNSLSILNTSTGQMTQQLDCPSPGRAGGGLLARRSADGGRRSQRPDSPVERDDRRTGARHPDEPAADSHAGLLARWHSDSPRRATTS